MHLLDYTILGVFFMVSFAVALAVRSRAARSIESYFLGERSLRWWLLGASGMASNVDMTGTMLTASLLYVFGFSGFWIELRGGIVLIMAFFLIYVGKWTRRSGCMTVAEWMQFRFGSQGGLPRLLNALFNIVFFVWAMGFFAVGSIKFFNVVLPLKIPGVDLDPGLTTSALLILIVMIYTAISGLVGVVWTDLLQSVLILFLAGYISVQAFVQVDPAQLQAIVGDTWFTLLPPLRIDPPQGYPELEYLGVAIGFYLLKTLIDGMSGAGGYMAQRFFAARSERECGLLSLFWIGLMSFRWPLMMGVAVLGLLQRERFADAEFVLPTVIHDLTPVGIRGLLIAGLLSAAMSTYSGMMNAGASYFVRDIYQAYCRPRAADRELIWVGYLSTLLLVIFALWLASLTRTINQIWDFLNMGLGVGLMLPNFLRWYWHRFNGYGYAAGAAVGMVTALALELLAQSQAIPRLSPYASFALLSGLSLLTMIAVSLATPAVAPQTLLHFYRTTRPFGIWGPVRRQVVREEQLAIDRENRHDLVSLLLALPWQLVLFLLPMALVIRRWDYVALFGGLLSALSVALYFTWFRRLPAEGASSARATASAG